MNGDHINIENFKAICTGKVYFHNVSCYCVALYAGTALRTTARQYGEVVLPDAVSGHLSWYFSQKAVTVQGGYGALFAVQVQSWLSITSVAVQV